LSGLHFEGLLAVRPYRYSRARPTDPAPSIASGLLWRDRRQLSWHGGSRRKATQQG